MYPSWTRASGVLRVQRRGRESRVGDSSNSSRMSIESGRSLLDRRRLLLDTSSTGTVDDLEIIRSVRIGESGETRKGHVPCELLRSARALVLLDYLLDALELGNADILEGQFRTTSCIS